MLPSMKVLVYRPAVLPATLLERRQVVFTAGGGLIGLMPTEIRYQRVD